MKQGLKQNISGFTIPELMIGGLVVVLFILPMANGLINKESIKLRSAGNQDSKIAATRLLIQLIKNGRLASSCADSSRNVLNCQVEIIPGTPESIVYTFDPQTQTLTYQRGPFGGALKTYSTYTEIKDFTVCSGNEIADGSCNDGGGLWVATPMMAVNPAQLAGYTRVRLTYYVKRIIHRADRIQVDMDGNYGAVQTGFFTRNMPGTPAAYRTLAEGEIQ
jgi:hypothetical protein